MKDQFHRILDLVRRTGDTMVVTDPNGEDVFVVMDLEQYEMFLDVNEGMVESEEEIDWNESCLDEEENTQKKEIKDPDIWQTMKPPGEEGETWNVSQMNEQELADLEKQYREFAERNVKDAINTSEKVEEKPVSKQANTVSDDFGEEQFYLEPIE